MTTGTDEDLLSQEIHELEAERRLATTDALKISLGEQIAAKENRLTALIYSRQVTNPAPEAQKVKFGFFEEFKGLPPAKKGQTFPFDGYGRFIFKRKLLVGKLISRIDVLNQNMFCRGPRGNGKTVLSLLLAQALVDRGEIVYMMSHAGSLRKMKIDDCVRLVKHVNLPAGKKFYLFIDEVQTNPYDDIWGYVLKGPGADSIVTVGFGLPSLQGSSPHFLEKTEPLDLMLTEEEIDDEVVKFFLDMCPAGKKISAQQAKKVLLWVLTYTGYHVYPFVRVAEHLFSSKYTYKYLLGGSEGNLLQALSIDEPESSKLFAAINSRCFELGNDLMCFASKMFNKGAFEDTSDEALALSKQGLWNNQTKWFVSDVFVTCLFGSRRSHVSLPESINLTSPDALEKLVVHALSDFNEHDFYEPDGITPRYENSLGAILGWKLSNMKGIRVYSQMQVLSQKPGTNPMIDFYINGRVNAFVELTRNGSLLSKHFHRFENKRGPYHRYKGSRYIILDFELGKVKPNPVPKDYEKQSSKYYCFVKKNNALYRGDNLQSALHTNVSHHLPSSPMKASFSTVILRKASLFSKRMVLFL